MDKPELKPCPFCNGDIAQQKKRILIHSEGVKIFIEEWDWSEPPAKEDVLHWVDMHLWQCVDEEKESSHRGIDHAEYREALIKAKALEDFSKKYRLPTMQRNQLKKEVESYKAIGL